MYCFKCQDFEAGEYSWANMIAQSFKCEVDETSFITVPYARIVCAEQQSYFPL